MPKPTQYKFSDFEHRFHELPEGKSYIRSHIGPHNSKSMMGGWNFFNDCAIEQRGLAKALSKGNRKKR